MSAQVGITSSPAQQVTPVIIKTGGGDSGPNKVAGQSQVTINLKGKTFQSPVKDDAWRSAHTDVPVGIQSLSIEDGKTDVGTSTATPESEELITLQIIYGTDMLVVREEALAEPHRTKLVITSPIPFTVLKPGTRPDQWDESTAWFPGDKPLVILTQGNIVLVNYQCLTDDVTLALGLDWDEVGG